MISAIRTKSYLVIEKNSVPSRCWEVRAVSEAHAINIIQELEGGYPSDYLVEEMEKSAAQMMKDQVTQMCHAMFPEKEAK